MEVDLTQRRPSYLPACTMSPSCFPVLGEFEYSRIHCCNNNKVPDCRRSSIRRWRNFIRRFVMGDGKRLYKSKSLSFHYDAESYAQNFDDGCHLEEPRRHSQVLEDTRCRICSMSSNPPSNNDQRSNSSENLPALLGAPHKIEDSIEKTFVQVQDRHKKIFL